jgi:hypothetical protein
VLSEGGGHGIAADSRTVHHRNGPIDMKVTLTAQTSGTALDVNVAGLPENEHCWLVAYGTDGTRQTAFQWDATYGGHARVNGSTEYPLDKLKQLVLLGSDHKPLDAVQI